MFIPWVFSSVLLVQQNVNVVFGETPKREASLFKCVKV